MSHSNIQRDLSVLIYKKPNNKPRIKYPINCKNISGKRNRENSTAESTILGVSLNACSFLFLPSNVSIA